MKMALITIIVGVFVTVPKNLSKRMREIRRDFKKGFEGHPFLLGRNFNVHNNYNKTN